MEPMPLTDADLSEYRDYVLSNPRANYCHDPAWRDIIRDTYGKKPQYMLSWDRNTGRVNGVAPAFWLDSLIFGRKLVSLPYLDYGGVLADDAATEESLVEGLRRAADSRGAGLEIRQERRLSTLAPPQNRKVRMTLPIAGTTRDGYWNALDAKVRNQVRKAEKSGITVQTGGEELLAEFYRVFCVNMRDLGSPVHAPALFRNILKALPGSRISLALWKGWCVGGLFRIQWKDSLIIPWASTLRKYRNHCPNNALYWDAIQNAFAAGCTTVDFGRSTRDEGTWHFKKQWMAVEGDLPWYSFDKRGEQATQGKGSLLDLAAGVWSKLPARYANWLGPQIRHALPQ